MYKSPIDITVETICNDIAKQQENAIYQCVIKQGIHIDKEELIRALQGDRNQYDIGAHDGIRHFARKLSNEITNAIESNYSAIAERISKHKVNRYEDSLCRAWDAKIDALRGILYYIEETIKKMEE